MHRVKNRGTPTGNFFTVALGYNERMSIVDMPIGFSINCLVHGLRFAKLGHLFLSKLGFSIKLKCSLIIVLLSTFPWTKHVHSPPVTASLMK